MITTGIIKEINVSDINSNIKDNLFKVELPYFNTPLNENSTGYEMLCTACTSSPLNNPYKVGDIVYVSFIDNELDNCVIIGLVYKGLENESRGYINAETVNVTNSVTLPKNTKLGDIKVDDLTAALNVIENLKSSQASIPTEVGTYVLKCVVTSTSTTFQFVKES